MGAMLASSLNVYAVAVGYSLVVHSHVPLGGVAKTLIVQRGAYRKDAYGRILSRQFCVPYCRAATHREAAHAVACFRQPKPFPDVPYHVLQAFLAFRCETVCFCAVLQLRNEHGYARPRGFAWQAVALSTSSGVSPNPGMSSRYEWNGRFLGRTAV